MADESSNHRIEQLLTENAQLKSEARDRRIKGKATLAELEKLRLDHSQVVKERDTYKSKAEAAPPSELAAKVEELTGIIRSGKHDAAFAEAAAKAGIDPKTPLGKQSLADLRALSGYKAEADEPDPAAIEASIAAAKVARPYLFPVPDPVTTTAPIKLDVPVDTTRGTGNLAVSAFVVKAENLQDLTWMNANAGKLAQAKKDGTLVYA